MSIIYQNYGEIGENNKPLYMKQYTLPAGSTITWSNTPIVAKKVWLVAASDTVITNVNPDTLEAEDGAYYWQSSDNGVTWIKQTDYGAYFSINGNTVSTTNYYSSVYTYYGALIISE